MSNVQPQLVLRAKLHDALTSGSYYQCKGSYRSLPSVYDASLGYEPAYCILGLAYHLINGQHWNRYFHDELEEAYGFRNPTTLLSLNDTGVSFLKFAKMFKDHPDFIYSGEVGSVPSPE